MSTSSSYPIIHFDHVSLSYDKKQIFDDLSMQVREGEKVAILGKSGLGKSSLFNLLLGFTLCQQGTIFFNGIPVNENTTWDIRKKIAFVDQDISLGQGNVSEWIHSIFKFKANAHIPFPQKCLETLLEYFELDRAKLDKPLEELSGGERQRIAIIASIALNRHVFLFDEITSALDKRLKEKVVDFFTREARWTVLIISHDAVWLNHPQIKIYNLEERQWAQ